jgi:hypothetical protein
MQETGPATVTALKCPKKRFPSFIRFAENSRLAAHHGNERSRAGWDLGESFKRQIACAKSASGPPKGGLCTV